MNELRPPVEVDETALLRRTANYARRIAPCLCNSAAARGVTCDWYHGFWPTLRLLGVSTNAKHMPLFEAGFARTARDGGLKRLMIAGGADNALLVQFLGACRRIGREPDITFVDRCATPVALNRWTARRLGAHLTCRVTELNDFQAEEPFDVICCHNLLIFVDPKDRAALMKRWHQSLRPGGRLLIVSRIHPDPDAATEAAVRSRAARLVNHVREACGEIEIGLPLGELLVRTERFALNMVLQNFSSDGAFSALIPAEDWDIFALEFGPIGVSKGELSAIGDRENLRRYAWLEAIRR